MVEKFLTKIKMCDAINLQMKDPSFISGVNKISPNPLLDFGEICFYGRVEETVSSSALTSEKASSTLVTSTTSAWL